MRDALTWTSTRSGFDFGQIKTHFVKVILDVNTVSYVKVILDVTTVSYLFYQIHFATNKQTHAHDSTYRSIHTCKQYGNKTKPG